MTNQYLNAQQRRGSYHSIILFRRDMGHISSRQKDDEELAYQFRKNNDKITRKILKLISKGYSNGYLREYEYVLTIGYFHGLKNRYDITKNSVFLDQIQELYDQLSLEIQKRQTDILKDKKEKVKVEKKTSTSDAALPTPSAPPEIEAEIIASAPPAEPKKDDDDGRYIPIFDDVVRDKSDCGAIYKRILDNSKMRRARQGTKSSVRRR